LHERVTSQKARCATLPRSGLLFRYRINGSSIPKPPFLLAGLNKDDNCDGQIDEERTTGECGTDGYTLYYYDGDGDTYGVTADTKCLCSPSGKYSATTGGDCDDSDARIHPGGSVCGMDGDCDGSLLDPGEVCDDGNSVQWDGCTDCIYLEFQVNTWTTDDQENPSITTLSNGGFVVVWESLEQDGSSSGVFGRIFSP
jgi:hypothetical protein